MVETHYAYEVSETYGTTDLSRKRIQPLESPEFLHNSTKTVDDDLLCTECFSDMECLVTPSKHYFEQKPSFFNATDESLQEYDDCSLPPKPNFAKKYVSKLINNIHSFPPKTKIDMCSFNNIFSNQNDYSTIMSDKKNLEDNELARYSDSISTASPHFILSRTYLILGSIADQDYITQMFQRERKYHPNHNYLQTQKYLTREMRTILFDWLGQVAEEFSIGRETYHLTLNFVDRILSKKTDFPKETLQLLGISALYTAIKLEENKPIKSADLALTTDGAFAENDICDMELLILKELEWRLMAQTTFSWIKLFCTLSAYSLYWKDSNNNSSDLNDIRELKFTDQNQTNFSKKFINDYISRRRTERLLDSYLSIDKFIAIMDILDVALLDYKSLEFYPSLLASGAFCLVHSHNAACVSIMKITGYSHSELANVMSWLSVIHVPYHGLSLPACPYFTPDLLNIGPDDFYTRQIRHPDSLSLHHSSIIERQKIKTRQLNVSSIYMNDTNKKIPNTTHPILHQSQLLSICNNTNINTLEYNHNSNLTGVNLEIANDNILNCNCSKNNILGIYQKRKVRPKQRTRTARMRRQKSHIV